jgi:hypothetical protein
MRTTLAILLVAMVLGAPLGGLLLSPTSGPLQVKALILPSPSSRALNATEHMFYTSHPPTIDGQLSPGEWAEAAVFNISRGSGNVLLYLMFDANKIYTAVDALSDVTHDTGDPGGAYITDPNNDYVILTFDADDGQITYQNTNSGGNEVMGQDAFSRGGKCVDRGATATGGTTRKAGWWNKDSTGNSVSFWSIILSNPNQGATEPFDYINTAFTGHRMYEHSIPYTGFGDELNLTRQRFVNVSVSVNDARGGNPAQIGSMPPGTNGIETFQKFLINSRPRAVLNGLGNSVYYLGETLSMDGTGSSDADAEVLTYEWDFDYDGSTFNADDTSKSTTHSYTTEGPRTLALRVTDPHGASDLKTGHIFVVQPETPPTFTNLDPASNKITIAEGSSATFKADYSDLNLGVPTEKLQVQWTLDGKVLTTENKTTAGTTRYTFASAYTGAHSGGKYVLKLRVNDTYDAKGRYTGGSMEATKTWNLTVTNVNRAPVIGSFVPPTSLVTTAETGPVVTFSITKSDPDGDLLTTSWSLDGVPVPGQGDSYKYLELANYSAAGDHKVRANVSDGALFDEVFWTVTVTEVNRAPVFLGLSPRSNKVTLAEGAMSEFSFSASDMDGDLLTSTWYIGEDAVSTTTGNDGYYQFKAGYTKKDGLDFTGSPYVLRLELSDGKATISQEWTVSVTDLNRAPAVVISSPQDGAKLSVKEIVKFDASLSTDPDGDALSYSWAAGDGKMSKDPQFAYQYNAPGEYTITLKVSDGKTETVKTLKIELLVPILRIDRLSHDPLSPSKGEAVTITATVQNLGNMDSDDAVVSFYIDNMNNKIGAVTVKNLPKGGSKDAILIWTAQSGRHNIIAQVEPSSGHSIDGTGKKELSLSVKAPSKSPGLFGMSSLFLILLLLLVLILVVLMIAVLASRRSKAHKDKVLVRSEAPVHPKAPQRAPAPMEAPPLPPKVEAPRMVAAIPMMCRQCQVNPPHTVDGLCDVCASTNDLIAGREASSEKVPPSPVISETAPKPVLVQEEGIEDFDLTEIFVVYEDGRLIDYATVKGDVEGDKDIISGMLVAIQNFVKTTMSAKNLDSFEMGDKRAIMERGRYLIMTCMVEGTTPPTLRDQMQDLIQKLEGLYAGVIENWDGSSEPFKDIRRHLVPLFRLKARSKIKEKEGNIQVKSAIEFYQGYVRLKVAVQNSLKTIITDAAFRLEWSKEALRLSRTEPEYPMDGSTVILGNIKPGEKKTVAYYLDPLICQESYLDGTLMYFDSFGKKQTADMKRRPADIVCPIFYTMETVNVAMLKRLLKELKYSDRRIYEVRSRPTLKAAFKLAKGVARGHDVKEVRELSEDKPFEAEAWFYGETKMSEEKLVIRIAARENIGYLELFVASGNLASLTGLLAELGHEFIKKVKGQGIMSNVLPSVDDDIRDQIDNTMLLLDKYAEAEIGVGETDID